MPEIHNHTIDKIALCNGLVSGVALYPQVWKVLVLSDSSGLSFITFFLIFTNSLVWLLYAHHRGLISLGIASFLNGLASFILLLALFYL